ncbi:hypothetical protein R3P38DRAFT_3452194 [Favolaschia claudopus]|uniref:Uncharacterized protein n=1 Tax=Favolaschia claudopus TaxID=2862362 RepID=A0AAV9ZK64_9AGAR
MTAKMLSLSPGVKFLAPLLIYVFSKPIGFGVGAYYLSRSFDIQIPIWATVLVAAASLPLYVTYRVVKRDARQRREAEAMGARLAPRISGTGFGHHNASVRTNEARAHALINSTTLLGAYDSQTRERLRSPNLGKALTEGEREKAEFRKIDDEDEDVWVKVRVPRGKAGSKLKRLNAARAKCGAPTPPSSSSRRSFCVAGVRASEEGFGVGVEGEGEP